MSGRSIIIAIFVVLALSAAVVPVMAGEESGTETITGMDPFSIGFENTGSDEMKVSWDITLTDGVPVNIVLLDEENHEKYTSYVRYEAYKGHQYNYTESSKRTVKVGEGKYYLTIESAHSSMDSSTIDYEVKWDEDADSGIFWAPWCWPVLIVLVLVFGVGILFLLWRMFGGGGHAAVGPRTDVAPAPGTGEVAELSPQPEPPDTPASDFGREASPEAPMPGTTTIPVPPEPSAPVDMPHDTATSTPEPGEPPDEPAPGTTTYYSPDVQRDVLAPDVEVPTPPGEPSAEVNIPAPPAETPPDGVVNLGPQPEPPDMPPAEAGEGSAHEPPAPGTTTYYGPESSATQLSPQPEPPDMPSSTEMVRPTGEGATELSPQPEPPDMPPSEAGEGSAHEPPAPGTTTYYGPESSATQLSPQPEPPDMTSTTETVRPMDGDATKLGPQPEPPDMPEAEGRPPEPDEGMEFKKKMRPPGDSGGDGPTGEPL